MQDQQQIDRIIYLASLASEREKIDPMLDTLRIITAKIQPGSSLPKADKTALQELEVNVKNYLLHDDPLRSFTPESLQQRLQTQENRAGATASSRSTRQLITMLVLSVGGALVPLTIPPYTNLPLRLMVFSVPVFLMGLAIGTAWFYLSSLTNFRPDLRRSFILLSIGVVFIGLSLFHYSITPAFGLNQYPLFKYGGITWIAPIGLLFIYLGLRTYAKLLRSTSRFMSLPLLLVCLVAAVMLASIAPHAPVEEEIFFDISLAGSLALTVFAAFGAVIAHAILRSVTAAYAKSMRMLFIYLVILTPSTAAGALAVMYVGALNGESFSLMALVLGTVPKLILLYTGYSFNKETSQ